MHSVLTARKRRWRRVLRSFKALLAFFIVGMAIVMGLVRLAVPWVVAHPEHVQSFLTNQLGRPIKFKRLQARWELGGPIFMLQDVRLGAPDDQSEFEIERAEWVLDFYAWLRSGVSFSEFRLVGMQIEATRDITRQWHIDRLGGAGRVDATASIDALLGLTGVSLKSARVRFNDVTHQSELMVDRFDIRVLEEYGRRHLAGTLWVDQDSEPLRFSCVRKRHMRCYLGGKNIDAPLWLARLPLKGVAATQGKFDLDLWVDFDKQIQQLQIELKTHDLVLAGVPVSFSNDEHFETRASLGEFSLSARYQHQDGHWRADWLSWHGMDEIKPDVQFSLEGQEKTLPILFRASRIRVSSLSPIAALFDFVPPKLRRVLYENLPSGEIKQAVFRIESNRLVSGSAQLEQLSLQPGARTPGVSFLSGVLLADHGAYVFLPKADLPLTVDYPHVFKSSVQGILRKGALGIHQDDGGSTEIALSGFELDGEGFAARGRVLLRFEKDKPKPFMDAVVRIDSAEVAKARRFWPLNVMSTQTVLWLDNALNSGYVEDGRAVVYGSLVDWPFVNKEGCFEASATVRNVDLAYHPLWPNAQVSQADVEFRGRSMIALSHDATSLHNHVHSAQAEISDFSAPILKLRVQGQGAGADLLQFARSSPIQNKGGSYWAGLEIGGNGDVDFNLTLPLREGLGATTMFGSVELKKADLRDSRVGVLFKKANGRLRFSQNGFAADDLAVQLDGNPADLSVLVGDFVSNAEHLVEANLRGELPVQSAFFGFGKVTELADQFNGKSAWNIDLSVGLPQADGVTEKRLTWRTDLKGTQVRLPAPLRKDVDSAMPITVAVDLPLPGAKIDVRWGEIFKLKSQIPSDTKNFSMSAALGAAQLAELPEQGVHIYGDVAALDLLGWSKYQTGQSTQLDVDVRAAELNLFARPFVDTQFRMQPVAEGTQFDFQGEAIQGQLVLPKAGSISGIHAQFDRLYVSEAMPQSQVQSMNIAQLPAMHLRVKDMRLGKAQFGEAIVETYPMRDGLKVDRIETSSPVIAMRGSGEWTLVQGVEKSNFDVTFTSEDLGKMLTALGYEGIVEGGQTIARIQGWWPGTPAQFSLAAIEAGVLEAKVGQGRILEVNPGAGRLLGLVSLQAIPRRLALDFSDFFKSGMTFDSIEGSFVIDQGNATTDKVVVKSPAADINVSGRTGLRQRDYDQYLQVTPRVSGVLPVVGGLVGGPAGAAAGLFAQGVLNRPMGSATQAQYHVTGTWDKPVVTPLVKSKKTKKKDLP